MRRLLAAVLLCVSATVGSASTLEQPIALRPIAEKTLQPVNLAGPDTMRGFQHVTLLADVSKLAFSPTSFEAENFGSGQQAEELSRTYSVFGPLLIDFKTPWTTAQRETALRKGARFRSDVPIHAVPVPAANMTVLMFMLLLACCALRSGYRAAGPNVYRRVGFLSRYIRSIYPARALFSSSSTFSRKPIVVSHP